MLVQDQIHSYNLNLDYLFPIFTVGFEFERFTVYSKWASKSIAILNNHLVSE